MSHASGGGKISAIGEIAGLFFDAPKTAETTANDAGEAAKLAAGIEGGNSSGPKVDKIPGVDDHHGGH